MSERRDSVESVWFARYRSRSLSDCPGLAFVRWWGGWWGQPTKTAKRLDIFATLKLIAGISNMVVRPRPLLANLAKPRVLCWSTMVASRPYPTVSSAVGGVAGGVARISRGGVADHEHANQAANRQSGQE